MKYRTAKVISHPRAGSHYLARLLNINFFHLPDYIPLYAGHSKGHIVHLKSGKTAVFYIHRNIDDSVKSMFVLRDRFGLVSNDLEHFSTTKLCDMHNRNIKSEAILNLGGKGEIVKEVDTALRVINLTPEEYICEHQNFWIGLKNKNFYPIAYENLIEYFEPTMLQIAQFLGSDKTEFIQEEQRVGWYDKKEVKKKFT